MTIVFNPNANKPAIAETTGAASLSATINSVTANNTLIVTLSFIDGTPTSGLTPVAGWMTNTSGSGTWNLAVGGATAGNAADPIGTACYYCLNPSAGSHTVKFTPVGGSGTYLIEMSLFEVSALTLDKNPAVTTSSTTTLTGPATGTLTNAVEFVVVACGVNASVTANIPTISSGFSPATLIHSGNSSNAGVALADYYMITAATTSLQASWAATSAASMQGLTVAFADASSAPASPPRRFRGPGSGPRITQRFEYAPFASPSTNVVGTISGLAVSTSTALGSVTGNGVISGIAVSQSHAFGSLIGTGAISGLIPSSSTAFGSVTGSGQISGLAVSTSNAQGLVNGLGAVSGVAISTSVAFGEVDGIGAVAGVAISTSTVFGSVTPSGSVGVISGLAISTSTAFGSVTGIGQISGLAASSTVVTGEVDATGVISGMAVSTSLAYGSVINFVPPSTTAVYSVLFLSNPGTLDNPPSG